MPTTISVRVDDDVKRDIESLLDKMGLNISTVVNMLFKQMLIDEALPFQPKYKRRYITTNENLKGYSGDYITEEWDTNEDALSSRHESAKSFVQFAKLHPIKLEHGFKFSRDECYENE